MLANAPRPHPTTAKHTPCSVVGPILTPWLKPVGVAAAEPGAAAAAAKANAAAGTTASNTPWWPQALREGKEEGTNSRHNPNRQRTSRNGGGTP